MARREVHFRLSVNLKKKKKKLRRKHSGGEKKKNMFETTLNMHNLKSFLNMLLANRYMLLNYSGQCN